jgi:hypothetical protein
VKKSRAGIVPLPLSVDVEDDVHRDSDCAGGACFGSVDGLRGLETSVDLPFMASGAVGCKKAAWVSEENATGIPGDKVGGGGIDTEDDVEGV